MGLGKAAEGSVTEVKTGDHTGGSKLNSNQNVAKFANSFRKLIGGRRELEPGVWSL